MHACASLCLFDTCPLLITRFLWDYLTRVRYLLPHFCVFIRVRWLLSYFCEFNWHVSSASYQNLWVYLTCPLAFIRFLCLFDTCRLPITRFMCVWHVSASSYQISVRLFDTFPFPVTRFLYVQLASVRFMLPDFCMFIWHVSFSSYQISVCHVSVSRYQISAFIWHVSVSWYHISVCLFDTCPSPVTRFLYVYLTRVHFPLPDFCMFIWHVTVSCYQISAFIWYISVCWYHISVCLLDTRPLLVTTAVRLSKPAHFLTFLFCGPEVAQPVLRLCGLLVLFDDCLIIRHDIAVVSSTVCLRISNVNK